LPEKSTNTSGTLMIGPDNIIRISGRQPRKSEELSQLCGLIPQLSNRSSGMVKLRQQDILQHCQTIYPVAEGKHATDSTPQRIGRIGGQHRPILAQKKDRSRGRLMQAATGIGQNRSESRPLKVNQSQITAEQIQLKINGLSTAAPLGNQLNIIKSKNAAALCNAFSHY
jgi:hypothetical protein